MTTTMEEKITKAYNGIVLAEIIYNVVTILVICTVIIYKLMYQETIRFIWLQILMLLAFYILFLIYSSSNYKLLSSEEPQYYIVKVSSLISLIDITYILS